MRFSFFKLLSFLLLIVASYTNVNTWAEDRAAHLAAGSIQRQVTMDIEEADEDMDEDLWVEPARKQKPVTTNPDNSVVPATKSEKPKISSQNEEQSNSSEIIPVPPTPQKAISQGKPQERQLKAANSFSVESNKESNKATKEKGSVQENYKRSVITPRSHGSDNRAAKELATRFSKIKDMEARFRQQKINDKNTATPFSRGKMAMMRPNHFRWEVLKPFPQLVVSDAVKVWIYDRELEQVTIQRVENQNNISPASILTSDEKSLSRRFDVAKTTLKSNTFYTLKPKDRESLFTKLELTFENDKIQSIMMWDAMGTKTNIEFTQVWTNVDLDKRIFEFSIPKGVDVISDEK